MPGAATARMLPDGRRLHLQHGPIDLVIEAWGTTDEVAQAYQQATTHFADILQVLVAELSILRQPASLFPRRGKYPAKLGKIGEADLPEGNGGEATVSALDPVRGPVARRMLDAIHPYRDVFITPMAAVAGSVADEMLQAMLAGRALTKAYVNDGGDIALHVTPGEELRLAVVANLDAPALDGFADIDFASPVRGIATSGWRGRSFSLGIADAATVLAPTAAMADAAATIVANAVTVDHPAIRRAPANTLRDDTDLGDLPVTVAVGPLPVQAIARALAAGAAKAEALRRRGLIAGAALALQGHWLMVGGAAPAVRHRSASA
jgi:ApbE superfamily uncharacterized protein (UPF0280 family)